MRRRRSRDAAALAAAIVVHGVVLLLLLLGRQQAPPPAPPRRDLALFDVAPPPPPPEPTHRDRPKKPAETPPGGSHAAAASTAIESAAAAPQTPALFLSRQPTSSPIDEDGPALLAGVGSADTARSGHDGDGAGTGTGSGTGSGIGPDALHFGRAEWIRVPSIDDFRPYLPTVAPGQTIVVSVKLGCLVPTPGKPKRCWIVSEDPPGFGIGRAAVRMSPTFRIRPVSLNDEPVDLPVMVPILLRISSSPLHQRPATDAKKPGHR